MVLNILKFILQKGKKRIIFKIVVKSAATSIFAVTLIIAPTANILSLCPFEVIRHSENSANLLQCILISPCIFQEYIKVLEECDKSLHGKQ
jgi:hypothetical protein